MSEISIRTEILDGRLMLVRLSGIFEGMVAAEAEAPLLDILKKAKLPQVWIDFSEIDYIDSSAIGVLINLTKAAIALKTQVSIYKPNENIKKVISVTHVDRLIPIVEG